MTHNKSTNVCLLTLFDHLVNFEKHLTLIKEDSSPEKIEIAYIDVRKAFLLCCFQAMGGVFPRGGREVVYLKVIAYLLFGWRFCHQAAYLIRCAGFTLKLEGGMVDVVALREVFLYVFHDLRALADTLILYLDMAA
jgi:hypothetical protein